MVTKYADRSTDSIDAMITGATGFLGRWLLVELTARGRRVLAPIRNSARRADELRAFVEAHGGRADHVVPVEGDLDAPGLGLDDEARALLRTAKHVFHLGARFAWGLDPKEAHRTNVEGTASVVELAATIPSLDRLVLVGGYRMGPRIDASGRRHLPSETEIRRAGAYEASKHDAHRVALSRARALGVKVSSLHPSTVIGDSRSGESTQVTGLGETILALARGELPVRVGSRATFVPVVTVDFVARVLAELADDPGAEGLELTLLDERTPRLDALIDRAASILGVRAPRIRVPVGLVRLLPEALTKTSREALVFLDEATYPVDETNTWLRSRGLSHPDFDRSFERWVHALVAREGRVP